MLKKKILFTCLCHYCCIRNNLTEIMKSMTTCNSVIDLQLRKFCKLALLYLENDTFYLYELTMHLIVLKPLESDLKSTI